MNEAVYFIVGDLYKSAGNVAIVRDDSY